MNHPSILNADDFTKTVLQNTAMLNSSKHWVALRPFGNPSILHRLKATWLVLTGKADVLTWTNQ
jgi:hypothetical protein